MYILLYVNFRFTLIENVLTSRNNNAETYTHTSIYLPLPGVQHNLQLSIKPFGLSQERQRSVSRVDMFLICVKYTFDKWFKECWYMWRYVDMRIKINHYYTESQAMHILCI